ncbi:MAG: alanine dehydrogenase [Chlorobium sp.]|jgi:alanine dehydrogenase|uniref:alanine dehydrogenase n=1 Tax=Chlorobium sp. TaxID=1095 RepID=UPI001DD2260B|nr:alanine dehydrogenase [Chlorobium sp.]MBN1279934.1 alanine dehydrogenase [Chlorobiaceae bacterium]MCF8217218.1 alanine dehydrogenase [Chlorobium sp.]MCF8272076.1 alanine dehydrogenase [Chlorobium sp.]MCF8288437.1 alanine dehydrogenase [Chlorobium sp.]MCF8292027.1 alanine dehydrogenase [Chlorobium sp.]
MGYGCDIEFDLGVKTLERWLIKPEKTMNITLGIPKERAQDERRVAISPAGVQILTEHGIKVIVEATAGQCCNFPDIEYAEAGASIAPSPEELYGQSNVIVKVLPPLPEEINFFSAGQMLLSALHLGTLNRHLIKTLLEKNVTALGFEFIETRDGELPIVRTLSEIAGSLAIQTAAKYLETSYGGSGILLGGIAGVPPANVTIIGAGTVGLFAAQDALGLGAQVTVIDKEINRLRRFEAFFNRHLVTAIANDHYISQLAKTSDVMIGALSPKKKIIRPLVSEQVVKSMKPGSVIIDVSIDQGACFATSRHTSHTNPIYVKHGVTHYCVPNIPSAVAKTASFALTNTLLPFLLKLTEHETVADILWKSHSLRKGTYIYKGYVTKKILSELTDFPFREIDLLLAAS